MQSLKTIRRLGILAATLGLTLGLSATAFAQSAADPTGEPPIGIEEKSGAKGPALSGVLSVKLINSNGIKADSAEIVARLRRGSMINSFYAPLPGPLDFDTDAQKAQLQADVLAAVRDDVFGAFYPEDCGVLGDQCPLADLVLKQADEFGLAESSTDQWVIMDVTVASTQPL